MVRYTPVIVDLPQIFRPTTGIPDTLRLRFQFQSSRSCSCQPQGYPERFAQEALGHNSKAIHRAYARRAQVELPPLSEFERMRTKFAEMSKTIEPMMAKA